MSLHTPMAAEQEESKGSPGLASRSLCICKCGVPSAVQVIDWSLNPKVQSIDA